MLAAAAGFGIHYIMSSASCDSLEAAMAQAPKTTWFQIYGTRDPCITFDLVRRAKRLGVRTLLTTIDAPVVSKRQRTSVKGLREPTNMILSAILQGLSRPGWTYRYLTRGGISMMQNWRPYAAMDANANAVAELYNGHTPAPASADLVDLRGDSQGLAGSIGRQGRDAPGRCVEVSRVRRQRLDGVKRRPSIARPAACD
ncbi:alpha-hydroxy-acid oxidizing protein [Bradyrhizobium macuxiense]|nr:alpha-hydroxy-acid oxidizing protein [Bradyrhizobium macuxiense]